MPTAQRPGGFEARCSPSSLILIEKRPKALLLLLKDIRNDPISKRHLIKGVMARGETSAWIGPPGSIQSEVIAQAAICVSSGTDWHGKKNKGAAGIVYFAEQSASRVAILPLKRQ